MNEPRKALFRTVGSGFTAVLACCLGVGGLYMVYGGLSLVGTTVWGYNDSEPIVYITFGGGYAVVGILLFFVAALLAFWTAAKPPRAPAAGDIRIRPARLALGATLAMVALAGLVFALAVGLATPDSTSRINPLSLFFASLAIALVSCLVSIRCFRD